MFKKPRISSIFSKKSSDLYLCQYVDNDRDRSRQFGPSYDIKIKLLKPLFGLRKWQSSYIVSSLKSSLMSFWVPKQTENTNKNHFIIVNELINAIISQNERVKDNHVSHVANLLNRKLKIKNKSIQVYFICFWFIIDKQKSI